MFGTDLIINSLDLVSIMVGSSESIRGNVVPRLFPVYLLVADMVSGFKCVLVLAGQDKHKDLSFEGVHCHYSSTLLIKNALQVTKEWQFSSGS